MSESDVVIHHLRSKLQHLSAELATHWSGLLRAARNGSKDKKQNGPNDKHRGAE